MSLGLLRVTPSRARMDHLKLGRRFFASPNAAATSDALPRERGLDSSLLTLTNVGARYGASQVLWNIDLSVEEGELVAVLGNNGAGKTTLLNTVMGLVTLAAGDIEFAGSSIVGIAPEARVEAGIVICPEGRRIFGNLSVEENLRLGAGLRHQHNYESARASVFELFPTLSRLRSQLGGNLSGGEQQQLAIGRALMAKPRLLLLDEPSLGLAPKIVAAIFRLITRLHDEGITMILVEQNAHLALEIADRGYVLSGGRVELAGLAADLRRGSDIEVAYLGL